MTLILPPSVALSEAKAPLQPVTLTLPPLLLILRPPKSVPAKVAGVSCRLIVPPPASTQSLTLSCVAPTDAEIAPASVR